MSLTMTRHHLLTPAAGLMPTQPSKKHHTTPTLPMPVPSRKSAPGAHHPSRARERDRSPEMLFDMSPAEGADAPIHYRALAAPPPGSSPAPSTHSVYSTHSYAAQPFPIQSKNRLSLVDASLAPIKTAPVPLNLVKNHEPFLYAFPTISPAQRSAPQSLPTRGRPVALRSAARTQPHTPSPPFGRGPSVRRPEPAPATPPLTGAFRGALAPSESGSFEDDFDEDELPPDAFFGSNADHWPTPPDSSLSASVKQHELDRGRQRAPKHRRY